MPKSDPLNVIARNILEGPLGVRCRSEQERCGLLKLRAICGGIRVLVRRNRAAANAAFHGVDQYGEMERDAAYHHGLALAVEVMHSTKDSLPEAQHAKVPGATWAVLHALAAHVKKNEASTATEFISVTRERVERRGAANWNVVAAVLDQLALLAPPAVAILAERVVPPAFIVEQTGVEPSQVFDHLAAAEVAEQQRTKAEEITADLPAFYRRVEDLGREYHRIEAKLAAAIELALSTVPETGEMADVAALVRAGAIAMKIKKEYQRPENEQMFFDEVAKASRVLSRAYVAAELAGLEWTEGERRALEQLILHPSSFVRYAPADPRAVDAKRRLRFLRDDFVGFHPPAEEAALLAAVRDSNADASRIVHLLGSYVSAKHANNPPVVTRPALLAALKAIYRDAWERFFEIFENASPLDGTVDLPSQLDDALAALEREELAASASYPAQAVGVRDLTSGEAPPLRHLRVTYLINPEGKVPRTATLHVDEVSALNAIEALIEEHAEPVEPVASLARAVYHYAFLLPEEHRHVWPKENVGYLTLHKLKRGSARIYCKLDAGELVFHVYARRDWKRPESFGLLN